MEYKAENNNVKMSPRKVRLVVDGIKKFDINQSLSYLMLLPNRSAIPVKKTLDSAVANAVNNFKAKKENLFIKSIEVGEGMKYKRFHYAGRGRIRPYRRKTSRIRVVLGDKTEVKKAVETKVAKQEVKKEKEGMK